MKSEKTVFTLFLLFASVFALALSVPKASPKLTLSKIAFGSCNNQNRQQTIWSAINGYNPDLWIWLGDNVYHDMRYAPIFLSVPLLEMKANYDKQKSSPLYSKLRNSTPVIGVWDDHDYGINDGDETYRDKDESAKLALDFLDEDAASPRWTQKGLFGSWTFGEAPRQVKVILLDIRYFQNNRTLLGEAQWTWFKDELTTNSAQITLIGSGIQLMGLEKPFERWGSHPHEFRRLMDLLHSTRSSGVVLLSGDVHYAQTYAIPPPCSPTGYDLYELGSSGLTHSCHELPLGVCYLVKDSLLSTKYAASPIFVDRNFGSIEIDWEKKFLTAQTRNVSGHVVREHRIQMDSLKFDDQKASKAAWKEGSECWPSLAWWDPRRMSVFQAKLILLGLWASGVLTVIVIAYKTLRFVYRTINRCCCKKKEKTS